MFLNSQMYCRIRIIFIFVKWDAVIWLLRASRKLCEDRNFFFNCSIPGGRLSMLVSGLHMASLSLNETELKINDNLKVPSRKDRDEKIRQIRTGFINRLHLNRPWAYSLIFCELLNFANVLMQIYLTDWFLRGAFLGLGQSVSEPATKDKMDPLDIIFPKVQFQYITTFIFYIILLLKQILF